MFKIIAISQVMLLVPVRHAVSRFGLGKILGVQVLRPVLALPAYSGGHKIMCHVLCFIFRCLLPCCLCS